jgi:hypothetical protein
MAAFFGPTGRTECGSPGIRADRIRILWDESSIGPIDRGVRTGQLRGSPVPGKLEGFYLASRKREGDGAGTAIPAFQKTNAVFVPITPKNRAALRRRFLFTARPGLPPGVRRSFFRRSTVNVAEAQGPMFSFIRMTTSPRSDATRRGGVSMEAHSRIRAGSEDRMDEKPD